MIDFGNCAMANALRHEGTSGDEKDYCHEMLTARAGRYHTLLRLQCRSNRLHAGLVSVINNMKSFIRFVSIVAFYWSQTT